MVANCCCCCSHFLLSRSGFSTNVSEKNVVNRPKRSIRLEWSTWNNSSTSKSDLSGSRRRDGSVDKDLGRRLGEPTESADDDVDVIGVGGSFGSGELELCGGSSSVGSNGGESLLSLSCDFFVLPTRLSAMNGRLLGGDLLGDVIVARSVYDRFTRMLRELVVRVATGGGGVGCCWVEKLVDDDDARMRCLSMFGCVIDRCCCWNGTRCLSDDDEDDDDADDVDGRPSLNL